LGGALLTLLGNFYLIPRLGFEGSAWTTLAAYASMVIAAYIWGQKAYPIPYELGKILPALFLAFACGYAVLSMPELQSLAWTAVPAYLMGVWLIERPWKSKKTQP
jgi:O-antigen/teichoic acid export membrane protein